MSPDPRPAPEHRSEIGVRQKRRTGAIDLSRHRPFGGGWGIRTPEGLHPTRFPSVRHRPLGESSRRPTRHAATCNGQRIYRHLRIGATRPGPGAGGIGHAHRQGLGGGLRRQWVWQASGGAGPVSAGSGRGRARLRPAAAIRRDGLRERPGRRGRRAGASSGMVLPGPSCGVIQRIPQDRKVARVSGLWRVHGGSSRAGRKARWQQERGNDRVVRRAPSGAVRPERCRLLPLVRPARTGGCRRHHSVRMAPVGADGTAPAQPHFASRGVSPPV